MKIWMAFTNEEWAWIEEAVSISGVPLDALMNTWFEIHDPSVRSILEFNREEGMSTLRPQESVFELSTQRVELFGLDGLGEKQRGRAMGAMAARDIRANLTNLVVRSAKVRREAARQIPPGRE